MRTKRKLYGGVVAGLGALLAALPTTVSAQQLKVGPTDIGGIVTSTAGPEAGVWVIAESTGLGTKRFAEIVVTDDQGRYLLPDLPAGAQYNIWVRGFGLVDSPRIAAKPGKTLNLSAMVAPNPAAAAKYYPGAYWWSLMPVPDKGMFPGTGPQGNGMPLNMTSQLAWLNQIKQNGCGNCHQAGGPTMRNPDYEHLGVKPGDTLALWPARMSQGQAGAGMVNTLNNLMTPDGGLLLRLAQWTDKMDAGQLPKTKPDRPKGVERNLVITLWDWSRPTAYEHDLTGTDKRNPTVNGYGKLYGAMELSTDWVPILDPRTNMTTEMKMPVRVADVARSSQANVAPTAWRYWGEDVIWDSQVNAHTNMMDQDGRIWWTATSRPQPDQPAYCLANSNNVYAKFFPRPRNSGAETVTNDQFVQNARGSTMFDPKTNQWSFVDTCFGTHHLNFGYDKDNTLFFADNGGPDLGWVNTRVFLETGNAEKAQGWVPFIVDTAGTGKCDSWVEPDQAVVPGKCKRFNVGFYGITPHTDGTIWGSSTQGRGYFVRVDLGNNPPFTALTEVYQMPANEQGMRGFDLDSKGVAWGAGTGGNLVSFDRSKCKVLRGPTATGDHCPEGFTMYPMPGPKFEGVDGAAAVVSSPYYTWTDNHNTLGLGQDAVFVLDNQSDGMWALTPDRQWVHIAIPYPMGFFAKGMEGRIDDINGGWSGRGLWFTFGGRAPWQSEGGKGTPPYAVHVQLRGSPIDNASRPRG